MIQRLKISWSKAIAVLVFLPSVLRAENSARQWTEESRNEESLFLNCSFMTQSAKQFISEGKYWSKYVEDHVDNKQTEASLLPPDIRFVDIEHNRCGRMKNKLLISNKGIKYCARNRHNFEQLQGDYYSYIIALMLSMNNVLPVFLLEVIPTSPMWTTVWPVLERSGWRSHAIVAVTPWIDSVRPVKAPKYIRDQSPDSCQVSCDKMEGLTLNKAGFLMQWSNLVLFDYITGNIDRLISHLHSLQWDRDALHLPIHNLAESKRGYLLFLDNELGLDHSYRLMSQYGHHHEHLLGQICVFRKSVVQGLKHLSNMNIDVFKNYLYEFNSFKKLFPCLSKFVVRTLKERMSKILTQVDKSCACL